MPKGSEVPRHRDERLGPPAFQTRAIALGVGEHDPHQYFAAENGRTRDPGPQRGPVIALERRTRLDGQGKATLELLTERADPTE